eukprot:GEMP01054122.1.p1 GENE.GEMP01054122.1~~GEMP01054122.1.p1  ORF type:complete len:400 (+),score=87.24 GEMP01054122.1:23-1222(+)
MITFLWAIAWADLIDVQEWIPQVLSPDRDLSRCELPPGSGHRVGVCKNVETLQSELEFCRDAVCYPACVPPTQPLWPEWTVKTKDKLLGQLFKKTIESRIFHEVNTSREVDVTLHFTQNLACIEAYKNALCWYNFPKCDCNSESLVLCRSVCENYYRACGFSPNVTVFNAIELQEFEGIFPECSDMMIGSFGLFSSYGALNKTLAGNQVPEAEHKMSDATSLVCTKQNRSGSFGRILEGMDLHSNTTARWSEDTDHATSRARKLATQENEEERWGYSSMVIVAPNSPMVLIAIAAVWEAIGLTIVVLMAFSPDYWKKAKSMLMFTFISLTLAGIVLIILQINALRIPPSRATESGPATVRCPNGIVHKVPETCATMFTMEQLETMRAKIWYAQFIVSRG